MLFKVLLTVKGLLNSFPYLYLLRSLLTSLSKTLKQLLKTITGETGRFYSEFYGRTELGYNIDSEFCRTAFTSDIG